MSSRWRRGPPLDEAAAGVQPLLFRLHAALEVGGGAHEGVLSPEAALPARPAPAPGGEGGGRAGLGAQGAGLEQVGAQQHPAAAAPLVGLEQTAEALLQRLGLLLGHLLETTGNGRER